MNKRKASVSKTLNQSIIMKIFSERLEDITPLISLKVWWHFFSLLSILLIFTGCIHKPQNQNESSKVEPFNQGASRIASGIAPEDPREGIVIELVKETSKTLEAKRLMEDFLKKYDLSPYFFTTKIQIESFVVPHSHPVLTLNTRHNQDPDFLLSTFLHEQLHWFLSGPYEPLTQKAIKVLKARYPRVPIGGPEGGVDEESTYLHLLVCWLELQADKRYLGEKRAYDLIGKADHYTWVYKQVLNQEKEIGSIIQQSGLSFRSANTIRSFVFADKLDRSAWLKDFDQLKKMISEIYPNLEVSLTNNKLSPRQMDVEVRSRLNNADSNLEAFLVLLDFVDKFEDGHLRLELKELESSNLKNDEKSLSSSTLGSMACQKIMSSKPKKINFLFPTTPELGFQFTQTQDNVFPLTILSVGTKKIGIVRIPSFKQDDYPELCAEEWEKYRLTFDSFCNEQCQDKFIQQILPNRLLHSFGLALEKLKSETIDGLLLDLTNNGGGTDWVRAVMRMLTDKKIVCGQFGFIRHPHWSKNFREQIAEIKEKIKISKEPLQRKELQSKMKQLEHDLRASERSCDRSNLWFQKNYRSKCQLVVKRPVSDCSPDDDLHYKQGIFKGSLFVLVNNGTASASEDLVGRYRDSKIALILGERTHGSGCGFTNGGIPLILSNSGIKVKISDCARYLQNGVNEVIGIAPDINLPMSDLRSDDFIKRLKESLARILAQK